MLTKAGSKGQSRISGASVKKLLTKRSEVLQMWLDANQLSSSQPSHCDLIAFISALNFYPGPLFLTLIRYTLYLRSERHFCRLVFGSRTKRNKSAQVSHRQEHRGEGGRWSREKKRRGRHHEKYIKRSFDSALPGRDVFPPLSQLFLDRIPMYYSHGH